MKYTRLESDKVIAGMENVRLDCARFERVPGADESFAMLRIVRKDLPFADQVEALFDLLDYLLKRESGQTVVFARFFLSDAANQEAEVLRRWEALGVSAPSPSFSNRLWTVRSWPLGSIPSRGLRCPARMICTR